MTSVYGRNIGNEAMLQKYAVFRSAVKHGAERNRASEWIRDKILTEDWSSGPRRCENSTPFEKPGIRAEMEQGAGQEGRSSPHCC
uniref:Uncharacterized protein n=1 Tax=Knipowitschia caucasica TaxID=637954 RepID=A0AAV2LUI8_KNICA